MVLINSYRFTPFKPFGNPSFTVLVGVEVKVD